LFHVTIPALLAYFHKCIMLLCSLVLPFLHPCSKDIYTCFIGGCTCGTALHTCVMEHSSKSTAGHVQGFSRFCAVSLEIDFNYLGDITG